MLKHVVLCVSGYSGSGKDEFVRTFVEDGDTKVGLADPAKRHMADLYGFDERQLFGPSSARNSGDMRYPRLDVRDLGLVRSDITAENAPSDLVGELEPGVAYWEYEGRGSESGGLANAPGRLPYIPGRLGSARVLVPEGHPSFWLSPREALQRYCELMNLMYEASWANKAMMTHVRLSETTMRRGMAVLKWGYYRMLGLFENSEAMNPPPGPSEVFVSCSADFRHRHEFSLARSMETRTFVPVLVRVKRPSVPEPPYDHRSETEMKSIPDSAFDFVVENSGSVEDLHARAKEVLQEASADGFKTKEWR